MITNHFSVLAAHYKSEFEIRKNLGEDTTGVRVKISQMYEQLGDNEAAASILD